MNVLVIRLGALGDFVQSFAPFAAIRAAHPKTRITLLTAMPYADMAARAPWFDRVLVDRRPAPWDLPGLWRLRTQLRGYDLVYDLQTSSRSTRYFWLAGRPRWSGIALGCSHPHANPTRNAMHTRERQAEQLRMAGIAVSPPPDIDWLRGDIGRFRLPARFALLAIGAAPHRPAKRWPAARFGALAAMLIASGVTPVVIGSAAEAPLAAELQAVCPAAIDLTGRTALADIAGLAADAVVAIGNDTGPMHLAAAMGCRCIVLFSAASDPALTAPRGPLGEWPMILRAPSLADLPVGDVRARVAVTLA